MAVVKAPTRTSDTVWSWVIRNRETGEVLFETWSRSIVEALNTAKYEAVPIQEYLGALNRAIKEADSKEAVTRLK